MKDFGFSSTSCCVGLSFERLQGAEKCLNVSHLWGVFKELSGSFWRIVCLGSEEHQLLGSL
ncbi:MAG TPA: hypothetical protein DCE42_22075 [Myxococcales bacterium]|nr:hypothetical protein [Deltaproteobacteria bacterium]HAA57469.1 hypothetical protein [Myxococcales bacterium]